MVVKTEAIENNATKITQLTLVKQYNQCNFYFLFSLLVYHVHDSTMMIIVILRPLHQKKMYNGISFLSSSSFASSLFLLLLTKS